MIIELDSLVSSGRGKIPLWKRLLKNTKFDNGHWLWQGYKMPSGHGQIRINYKMILLHRLSAHIYHGMDLLDMKVQANHKNICRESSCWNPEHIYVGTQKQNVEDRQEFKETRSGSNNRLKTHCIKGHEYNEENTTKRNKRRHCKVCHREKAREKRVAIRGQ